MVVGQGLIPADFYPISSNDWDGSSPSGSSIFRLISHRDRNPRDNLERNRSTFLPVSCRSEPVRSFRHVHLETCPFPGFPVLRDCDAGYRKDLAGEEEAQSGMLPEPPLEQMRFISFDNPDTIILADKDEPFIGLMGGDGDLRHGVSAMPEGIFDQVIEDLLEQWICINCEIRPVKVQPHLPHGQGRNCPPDTFIDILPDRCRCSHILVGLREVDLEPDGFSNTHLFVKVFRDDRYTSLFFF